ncbi:MAG: histidine kinase dimerization/phospho-acceptor domain-containing protein, partial [Pseudomonadales bacterium]|nr:histidine kinase dimerization/phospho-acceptor domain-containing protein [Pseudomonadales bacterium]
MSDRFADLSHSMARNSPGVPLPPQEGAGDLYLELLARTADAVVVYEQDGFTACNEAAVRLFGLEHAEQLLQLHPSDVSPPTQPDGRDSLVRSNELLAQALEHGSHRFEWTHACADGTPLACEVLLTPIRIDGRMLVHAVIRDLSAVKALEAQLLHAQRLDALGRLAGGIAHDFNNLLAVLLGRAQLLGDHLDGSAAADEHLAELQDAGERAAALVRELLLFSRREPPELRTVDLGAVLRNALPMLRSLVGDKVDIEMQPARGALTIRADVVLLEQVMLNLAANARDAMPEGGRLRIECGTEGERILLAFKDEGS